MTPKDVRRIACVGEVMLELSAPAVGDTHLGVAGDTYNTAVYLKRMLGDGFEVDYVTALGRDDFSDRIVAQIARHGLGQGAIERREDRAPGLYAIATSPDGERSFSYWRSESAARTLFSQPCSVPMSRLAGYDMVYLSGITLAVLPLAIRNELAAFLRDYQGLFVYDSNHRPRLWESAETARQTNKQFWGLADIALPSVDDEMEIYGDASQDAVVARLNQFGANFGALKRGEDGPRDLSGASHDVDFPPAQNVIDTTAAGDSFNAGYLTGLIQTGSTTKALLGGHILASKVVGVRGAIAEF